ncbi:hypothetical protein GCM10027051_21250 [Niabella terrae]
MGTVSGIVKDSADDYGLQSVTITVYKKADSSLVNYQISGEDGSFSFSSIPLNTPFIFNFSFTGYQVYSRALTLDSTHPGFNFNTVRMGKKQGMMEEVVVQAVVPVTMNGDTLEINPGAFKLDSNAVVEDMLRRVPGVTMWGDGTITVNGKTVNNVYVDGKPFFGSDPAIATQNLPKKAIEKIQVYSEEDYSKDNIDDNPEDSLLTMNIKLRADKKKGFFGKLGGGLGTDRRFEADASALGYREKLRGGIAASINNINKTAGLQEMFRQGTYRNYNPNNKYVANFGSSGINRILTLGGNMQYDFSETTNSRFNNQLRANYTFTNKRGDVSSSTDARKATTDDVILEHSERQNLSQSDNHSGSVSYNKRDGDKDLSLGANISSASSTGNNSSKAQQEREGAGLVSENTSGSTSNNQSNNFGLNASFRNKDDDDRNLKSFGINYNLDYGNSENNSHTVSDFVSYENAARNRSYDRIYNNTSSSFSNSLNMNYNALKRLLFGNFNLWNINMVLSNRISHSKNTSDALVSDYDSLTGNYLRNDTLTNFNEITRFEDRPSLRLSKNFRKRLSDRFNRYINVTANLQGRIMSEKNSSNFAYRNLNRNFSFFMPSASVSYHYQKYNQYTIAMGLSGNSTPSIPTINQLRPIVDSINQYNINLGNPNLQPYTTNSLDFNFSYRREQGSRNTDYSFNLNGGINDVKGAIVDSSFYDKEARRTTYLINRDGRKVYNGGFNMKTSFKLPKNKVLQFNYAITLAKTVSPNYIDSVFTNSRANNMTNRVSLFYTLGDIGNIELAQSVNTSASTQSTGQMRNLKTSNYITQGNLNINPFRDLMISNSMNYVKNSTTGETSALWNAFATYRFLSSKQAEVKLSAMDILGQYKNISSSSSLDNVSTTVTSGLQQFFMVTLSYYPRQFGGGRGRSGRRAESGERDSERRDMRRSERAPENRGSRGPGGSRGSVRGQ